jgi:hypothetical protein
MENASVIAPKNPEWPLLAIPATVEVDDRLPLRKPTRTEMATELNKRKYNHFG